MKGRVGGSSRSKHPPRIKGSNVFPCVRVSISDSPARTFVCAHVCLSVYRPRALGPFFFSSSSSSSSPHCAASSPLGRKTREINCVSCWWGFDVKSWGETLLSHFFPFICCVCVRVCVIHHVQPPPKSPSPSCHLLFFHRRPHLETSVALVEADRHSDSFESSQDAAVFLSTGRRGLHSRRSRVNVRAPARSPAFCGRHQV